MREPHHETEDFMQSEAFQEFLTDDNVTEEGKAIIRELAKLPKSVFLENHNSFSRKFEPGGIGKEFRARQTYNEKRAATSDAEDSKLSGVRATYYQLMAEFAEMFDGCVALRLNRLFENS